MKRRDFNLRLEDAVAYGVYLHESELTDAEVVAKLDEIQQAFLAETGLSAEQALEAAREISDTSSNCSPDEIFRRVKCGVCTRRRCFLGSLIS